MWRVLSPVAVAVAAGACSGAAPAPRPAPAPAVVVADASVPADTAALDQDLVRLAERSLAMYRDIAQALAGDTDCVAATIKLRELAAGYRDVVATNAQVLRDGRAAELRAALAPHNEALDRAARALMTSATMASCAQDTAFAQAFDELLEPPP
jgi:hypothetical protein